MIELLLKKCQFEVEKGQIVTFVNPYSYLLIRKYLDACGKFDHIYIDGISLVLILRFLTGKNIYRMSFDMTSLARDVFGEAENKRETLFIIGAAPDVISRSIHNIKTEFPYLNIIGHRHGFFVDEDERRSVLNKIAAANPDLVIVGMGCPLQEKFLLDLKFLGWSGTGYTCGGFLHQTARSIKYYPDFINKYNLRWLYRVVDEPKLFKRYFMLYPMSFLVLIYDIMKYKKVIN